MAYEYYCTNCGKNINQEVVLFDMRNLIIEDQRKMFNVLKLRMTGDELKRFIASGKPGDGGFRNCTLSFAKVMEIISNVHNLNDFTIGQLTLTDIKEFIANSRVTVTTRRRPTDDDDDGWGDEEEQEEEEKAVYVKPAAIEALERASTSMVGEAMMGNLILSDLELLQNAFSASDTISIQLKEYTEQDTDGHDVLVGYHVIYAVSHTRGTRRTRVCPYCDEPIFEYAGRAKHQTVVFIGNPAAGKTSTILALAHYATNQLAHPDLEPIWHGSRHDNNQLASVELIAATPELQADLRKFAQGIAPQRTEADARKKAYSASFWIKNKHNNRYYLLTLMDLPGEVCNKEGTGYVDEDKLQNQYTVALNCDAFIACFDATTVQSAADETSAEHHNAGEHVNRMSRQVNEFQNLRARFQNVENYVPTMVLFTKSKDLEEQTAEPQPTSRRPMDLLYCFRGELEAVQSNGVFGAVNKAFQGFGKLAKSYRAMIRCSPYGYPAPNERDLANPNNTRHAQPPTPRHVDQLMLWLLEVTGCMEVKASYKPNPASVYDLRGYHISRVQYRSDAPDEAAKPYNGSKLDEALARNYLFENPGYYDRKRVQIYGLGRSSETQLDAEEAYGYSKGISIFGKKVRNDDEA